MSVTLHLHPNMVYLAENNDVVETFGTTVGKCIEALFGRYPGLRELVFYKDGQL